MSTPKRTQRYSNLNSSPKKVPRATELQDAKVITRTSRGVKDRSIHAYELPFCNDGSGYGEVFEGKMGALHLEHNLWAEDRQKNINKDFYCESSLTSTIRNECLIAK